MIKGDLIQFIELCDAFSLTSIDLDKSHQIPLWPTSTIYPGEVGIILKSQPCEDIGTLLEVLIGNTVFADVPESKVDYLPTSTTHCYIS